MAIKLKCKNYVSFDAETKRYVVCGKEFAVGNEPGDHVQCPACGADLEVPFVQRARAATVTSEPKEQPSSRPTQSPTENELVDIPLTQPPASGSVRLTYSTFEEEVACLKCGTRIDGDVAKCPRCGTLRRFSDETPVDQMQIQPAGFKLWLLRLTTKGDIKQIEMTVHLMAGILWLMLGALMFALFRSLIFVALILWLMVGAVYVVNWQTWRSRQVDPLAPLTWWQATAWAVILGILRVINFRTFGSQSKMVQLNQRNQSFSDEDLAALPKLASYQVLDLEGTEITDAGLKRLRYHPQLQYLIVRDTGVTPEGVFRLQQTVPACWIWQ